MFPEDVILFHFQPWTPSAFQLAIHKALIRVILLCNVAILGYIKDNGYGQTTSKLAQKGGFGRI
jgi:hypothetical protein